jgi:hypothetical protein
MLQLTVSLFQSKRKNPKIQISDPNSKFQDLNFKFQIPKRDDLPVLEFGIWVLEFYFVKHETPYITVLAHRANDTCVCPGYPVPLRYGV